MLALFFLANALATVVLIAVLQVRAPTYQAIPWIFAAAFVASCFPSLRRRMTTGALLWRLLPVLLYVGVITLASSVSPTASMDISSKVFHPVEYAGLAFLAQFAANGGLKSPPCPGRLLWVAVACLALAVLDEVHQSFVPARTAAAGDVLLDALGIGLGTLLLWGAAAVARRTAQSA